MKKVPELLGEDSPCFLDAVHSWQFKYGDTCPSIDVAFPSDNLFFSFLSDNQKGYSVYEKSISKTTIKGTEDSDEY
jgi:hypothetical protein